MRSFHLARLSALAAMVLVLAGTFAWPAGAEPRAVADNVAIVAEDGVTRFELSLDRDLHFSVFALADPYRVIIDLPETEFQISADQAETSGGLISAFRFGLFSPGKSRIVIDATGPISIADPVIHKPANGQPARLVVELASISRNIFLSNFAMNGASRVTAAAPPVTRVPVIPPLPRQRNEKPVIVIDPGHGGVDPGATTRSGTREKELVLEFSKDLAEKLRATGQFKVVLTRTSDVFVRLDRRRQIARDNQADLFVSVHADSIRISGVRGATVYTVSEKASDEEAAALARQENRADLIAGVQLEEVSDEVSDILIDLARRNTKKRSIDFAKVLVNKMRANVKLNSNPHRSASFVVLKSADVPSVLLELGYLSNKQDADALRSRKWRTKASASVVGAVAQFFAPRLAENQ